MRNNKGFQYDAKYDPARKQTSKFAKFWYYKHKTAHRIFHAILFLLLLITQLVSVTINIVNDWTIFICIVLVLFSAVLYYELIKVRSSRYGVADYSDLLFLLMVLVYQIHDIYLICHTYVCL